MTRQEFKNKKQIDIQAETYNELMILFRKKEREKYKVRVFGENLCLFQLCANKFPFSKKDLEFIQENKLIINKRGTYYTIYGII